MLREDEMKRNTVRFLLGVEREGNQEEKPHHSVPGVGWDGDEGGNGGKRPHRSIGNPAGLTYWPLLPPPLTPPPRVRGIFFNVLSYLFHEEVECFEFLMTIFCLHECDGHCIAISPI